MKRFLFTIVFLPCSFLYGNGFLSPADFDSLKPGYVVYSNNDTLFGRLQMMRGAGKNFVFLETVNDGNRKIFIGQLKQIVYGNDVYRIIKMDDNGMERLYYARTENNTLPVKIYPSYTWLEQPGTTGGSPIFSPGPMSTILQHAWIIQHKEDAPKLFVKNNDAGTSLQKALLQYLKGKSRITTYLNTIPGLSFDDLPEAIAHINTLQP